jgi:hypothetical protein
VGPTLQCDGRGNVAGARGKRRRAVKRLSRGPANAVTRVGDVARLSDILVRSACQGSSIRGGEKPRPRE